MEERDGCDVITFMNNTPSGIDWKRVVITKSTEVGKLKGGSAQLYDPKEYVCPSWLSAKKAKEIWKLHTGKNREFTSGDQTKTVFWKYFKDTAVTPSYRDFSSNHLRSIGEWKEEDENNHLNSGGVEMAEKAAEKEAKPVTKRKRITIPSDAKIGTTGKQPKSPKNIERVKLYRRSKLSTILEKNPGVTLADIKYDIKCGYAEIVG